MVLLVVGVGWLPMGAGRLPVGAGRLTGVFAWRKRFDGLMGGAGWVASIREKAASVKGTQRLRLVGAGHTFPKVNSTLLDTIYLSS